MLRRIAPKATKGKGRSWKAHQSSSSNPETNKFRAKARLMRLQNLAVQAGNSMVTVDFNSMTLSDKSKSNSTLSLNKLVKVKVPQSEQPKSQKRKRNASTMEEEEDSLRAKKVRKPFKNQPQSEDEFSGNDSDDDKPKLPETMKTRGIYRDTTKTGKDEPGAQFRAKKAAGDMKKKGAPEPYAYLPFDRKKLKRRSGGKDQFKGIIGAARKGAMIGQKLRNRKNKTK